MRAKYFGRATPSKPPEVHGRPQNKFNYDLGWEQNEFVTQLQAVSLPI